MSCIKALRNNFNNQLVCSINNHGEVEMHNGNI